ncbi:hypothetical protein BC834DRAFT_972864 [Gloeopeniophorella convolvens]|nr:hypothetical protein BC834DRAFT_972864 [Gloeopeniophorella convolvens]
MSANPNFVDFRASFNSSDADTILRSGAASTPSMIVGWKTDDRVQFTTKASSVFKDMQALRRLKFPNFVEAVVRVMWKQSQKGLDLQRVFDCLDSHMREEVRSFRGNFDLEMRDQSAPIRADPPGDLGAPFDREDTDPSVRSTDDVDFHVHMAMLSLASVV